MNLHHRLAEIEAAFHGTSGIVICGIVVVTAVIAYLIADAVLGHDGGAS